MPRRNPSCRSATRNGSTRRSSTSSPSASGTSSCQLQTDRERDIFLEAFWKHRDPTPGTPKNEFEEEHRRRLDHANKFYGRSVPLPGWRTDRGRIYILLGPPQNIEQYSNVNGVYPTEIWFYLGDPALGLPTAFNVIFFRKEGVGDYILYSPTEHGPRSLIASSMGGYRDVTPRVGLHDQRPGRL